jgi:hypothetical protein
MTQQHSLLHVLCPSSDLPTTCWCALRFPKRRPECEATSSSCPQSLALHSTSLSLTHSSTGLGVAQYANTFGVAVENDGRMLPNTEARLWQRFSSSVFGNHRRALKCCHQSLHSHTGTPQENIFRSAHVQHGLLIWFNTSSLCWRSAPHLSVDNKFCSPPPRCTSEC